LLSTLLGTILGLVLLGLSFQFKIKNGGLFALESLVLYVAFFAIGMGPIPWAVNGEIYQLNIRSRANSLATTVNWLSNLIVSLTFLTYINLVGTPAAFWTYAGFGVLCWIIMYFKMPETKGLSMEKLQQVLKAKSK